MLESQSQRRCFLLQHANFKSGISHTNARHPLMKLLFLGQIMKVIAHVDMDAFYTQGTLGLTSPDRSLRGSGNAFPSNDAQCLLHLWPRKLASAAEKLSKALSNCAGGSYS
jgi:hypothetical protein